MAGGGTTKRMSVEEKKKCLLQIYHRTALVYTEKEICALGAAAGIQAQSVAEINQALVDDGCVDREKVAGAGSTWYYWSFPAKQDFAAQRQHQQVLAQIQQTQTTLVEVQAQLAAAQRGREEEVVVVVVEEEPVVKEEMKEKLATEAGETNEGPPPKKMKRPSRAEQLQQLQELQGQMRRHEQEIQSLAVHDPQAVADLERELQLVTEAAHRWTDNIHTAKSYLVKKRGLDSKEACKLLGISADFDYPEDKIPK